MFLPQVVFAFASDMVIVGVPDCSIGTREASSMERGKTEEAIDNGLEERMRNNYL